MLKEKNHRFNGRYEELTGDIKRGCAEVDDEERCNRALFWEYSTKQPLFECKWQVALSLTPPHPAPNSQPSPSPAPRPYNPALTQP